VLAIYGAAAGSVNSDFNLIGQFTIATQSVLEIRAITSGPATHGQVTAFSNSTAGADQRTTIKLWKLA